MPEIDKFDKLYEDMYIGRGEENKPMTTRVALLENNHDDLCDRLSKIEKTQDRMLWLSLTTLVGVLIDLVIKSH